MNRYQIEGKTYGVLDSELWLLIEPSADNAVLNVLNEIEPPKEQTEAPARSTRATKSKVSPEVQDEIREKFSRGVSRQDLMKQYGLSYPTVQKYCRTKPMSKRTSGRIVNDYVCENGHEFRSKMSPGDAMCPTCHSRDCDLGTLNGPVKDDLEN